MPHANVSIAQSKTPLSSLVSVCRGYETAILTFAKCMIDTKILINLYKRHTGSYVVGTTATTGGATETISLLVAGDDDARDVGNDGGNGSNPIVPGAGTAVGATLVVVVVVVLFIGIVDEAEAEEEEAAAAAAAIALATAIAAAAAAATAGLVGIGAATGAVSSCDTLCSRT
jgi:hypothetical protein